MQPFVIGYFKEEIYEEDPVEDSKNGTKVYINPRDLFTKDFLNMKSKNITAPAVLHKRDLWWSPNTTFITELHSCSIIFKSIIYE